MGKSLYKVTTRGCGTFHVIADTFDKAANEVRQELDDQDFGFSTNRVVINVEFVCREVFMSNGKRSLCGYKDENHLMVAKEKENDKEE